MPKRKREDPAEAKAASIKAQRAEHKLHHGQNVLRRAFNLAKGFERQKLGRRRKTALSQKDEAGICRIDAETEALKVEIFQRHFCHL